MITEIYYFSGTGNSLIVARDIAEKMKGKLTSIPSIINKENITTEADIIGIVFPIYYVGFANIPLIVQQFVKKLDNISKKYIFAVCTYGGGAGNTYQILDEMIKARGGHLASGFGVQMPQNAFKKPFENKEKLYSNWKNKKLPIIHEYIIDKNDGWFDKDGLSIRLAGGFILLFKPLLKRSMNNKAGFPKGSNRKIDEIIFCMDKGYQVDENCTNCGTCFKICPVKNIEIVDDKPVWQHHCENCLACIKWCPQKAIHGYGELPKGYHHPDVKLSDMLKMNK